MPEQLEGVTVNEVAPTPQMMPATMHRHALDILGLNHSQMTTTRYSLEIEVETYLNNNSVK